MMEMTKHDFLEGLSERLRSMPDEEKNERLEFYAEIIDDYIDDGLTEDEAVAKIGSLDEVALRITELTPAASDETLSKKVKREEKAQKSKEPHEKRGLGVRTITLLAISSPLWIVLLAAAFAVVITVYASLWAILISLWSLPVSLAISAVAAPVAFVVFIVQGFPIAALGTLGAGFFALGLAVFLFFGCMAATKGTVYLTKKMGLGIWRLIAGRRA